MTIRAVRPAKKKGHMQIFIENQQYILPDPVYSALGCPGVGDPVDPDLRERLLWEDSLVRAMDTALRLLAYMDNSPQSLCGKLRRRGYTKEVAEQTVCDCIRLGYVDEQRQLARLVRELANRRLYGAGRIYGYLSAHGYQRESIAKALQEAVDSGEIDFEENLQSLLEKKAKNPEDPTEKRKLMFTYGYKR